MLDSVGDAITEPLYDLTLGGYLRNMFERMGRARRSGPIFLEEHLSFWQWGGHYVTPITVSMATSSEAAKTKFGSNYYFFFRYNMFLLRNMT